MFVDLQSRWHQKKPNIRFLDVQLDEFILQISTSNTVRDIKMQRGYYTKSHEIERERERERERDGEEKERAYREKNASSSIL